MRAWLLSRCWLAKVGSWSVTLVVLTLVAACLANAVLGVAPAPPHMYALPKATQAGTVEHAVPTLPFDKKAKLDVLGWALLDRRTGEMFGQNQHEPSYTASVMKIWYAQDADAHGVRDSGLEAMIRDSDNDVADRVFARLGAASTRRAVDECGLTDAVVLSWSWSRNSLSAADLVKLGVCITDPTVLQWMTEIRGESDFGPRDLLGPVAAKNGWMLWDGTWYVNCLAVTPDWALAIVQQYPELRDETWTEGFDRGKEGCRDATAALLLT